MTTNQNHRVVVARYPNGGIGDHLSGLIGAWYFAKRTGRHLVIDWRGSRYNPDQTLTRNCFNDLFEAPSTLLGVPIICDDSVSTLDYSLPIYPCKWDTEKLTATAHQSHTAVELKANNTLVTSSSDRPEPTVVFNQWISPAPPKSDMQAFLSELRIGPAFRGIADDFWSEQMENHPGVAIHIRHGNGENIGLRAAYWLGPFDLMRQLGLNARTDRHRSGAHGKFADNMPDSLIPAKSLDRVQKSFLKIVAAQTRAMKTLINRPTARPILFCDSNIVANELRAFLPDLVIPPKSFVEAGAGPLHAVSLNGGAIVPVAENITRDMMVELELMRRCEALICMDSNFSAISRIELDETNVNILQPPLLNKTVTKVATKVFQALT